MDRDEQEPVPVRRALRSVSPDETPESILPGLPRVASLDALLREVDGLRSTLDADLGRAADAVEAGRTDLAISILGADQDAVGAFEQRALGHLVDLAEPLPAAARRRRFRVPVAPFVAAAAVVGFVLSIAPQVGGENPTSELSATTVAANGALDRLRDAAAEGDTTEVRATAFALHEQLLSVVADAATDPAAAQRALLLLSYERDAINRSGDSVALHDVLVQSTQLANRIRAALPRTVQISVPPAPPISRVPASPTASPTPKPSATQSPAPKPKPTTSASPAAQPTTAPTAEPTATTDPGPLSGAGDSGPFG